MTNKLKIKDVVLDSDIVLAPLAGVTDASFRSLAHKFGAGLTYTEMVSAKGLNYNNENTKSLLKRADNEKLCAVQIFGSNPIQMEKAIKSGSLDSFEIIDINMGCPVKKVVNSGEGSALMQDISLAEKIVSACSNATQKPVTVKFRSGWDEMNINAVDFAKMCEQAGASAVTIHARTAKQMYSGKSDWKLIEKVKNAVKIPVIGNGDVGDKMSYIAMKDQTGVDGVMIGRASLGRVWIFSELLDNHISYSVKDVILEHVSLCKKFFGERYTVCNMRKHIAWYVKGIKNASLIKNQINTICSTSEMVEFIEKIEF